MNVTRELSEHLIHRKALATQKALKICDTLNQGLDKIKIEESLISAMISSKRSVTVGNMKVLKLNRRYNTEIRSSLVKRFKKFFIKRQHFTILCRYSVFTNTLKSVTISWKIVDELNR